MTMLLTEDGEKPVAGARVAGERLWLDGAAFEDATGWSFAPEGLCREGMCVPLPPGREADFVQGDRVDLAAVWRHLGKPIVHDAAGGVWALGESAEDRAAALRSLEAPDFALPDSAGRLHALSDYRGKKVLLVSWASW
jgi:AhpC/TSA family